MTRSILGTLAADTRAVHTRDGSSIDRVGCLGRQDRDLSGLSMYVYDCSTKRNHDAGVSKWYERVPSGNALHST